MRRRRELVGRKRPIEFQILGITPPAWEPIDSLAVGRLLTWRLAENHQAELVRGALATKFGEEAARFLTGRYPGSAPAILQRQEPSQSLATAVHATGRSGTTSRTARELASPPVSSGWRRARGAATATTGCWPAARRKSGRPILANDPHLQIEFPSVWYEMHLVAAGLDVIGVTIPGVPFVALGHNARIAWGMTATGADVQDLVSRARRRRQEAIDVSRRVGADRDRHRRHSGARPQRRVAVRGLEDAQRPDLRGRRSGLGRAAVVAVAGRPSLGRAAGVFAAVGCRRRSRDRVRGDQPRQRLDVVHRRRSARSPRRR